MSNEAEIGYLEAHYRVNRLNPDSLTVVKFDEKVSRFNPHSLNPGKRDVWITTKCEITMKLGETEDVFMMSGPDGKQFCQDMCL